MSHQPQQLHTVHAGSKAQTEQIVREVATSVVAPLLEPPIIMDEVLYAPNIVGRFVGNGQKFMKKVAFNGITLLRNTEQFGQESAFKLANQALSQLYGEYYGGGIRYFQPVRTKK